MSIFLTLISGKGGSGKTTIGLSIAKLLSQCEKKVLLVDCDMSTHGATYFFESYLTTDAIGNISTTKDFLENLDSNKLINPIKNNNNIDFIPSVKEILNGRNDNLHINRFSEYINKNNSFINDYDLIILDCQAGYSQLNEDLVNISDVCLFVLEADSVSASAMRALYTQLSFALSHQSLKSYQVFNKLRENEAAIYSDIKYGTFFTNIKPILFDWSVRKSFQDNMIPLINEKNSSFTSDICCLTRNLFPMFKDEILKYEIKTKHCQLNDKVEEVHKIKQQISRPKFVITSYIIAIMTCLIGSFIIILNINNLSKYEYLIILLGLLLFIIIITICNYEEKRLEDIKHERAKIKSTTKEIESIKQEIELLEENSTLTNDARHTTATPF